MQPGGDEVLVVARVAEERGVGAVAVRDTWDVLVHAARAELQLGSDRPVRVLDVQIRAQSRAAAEHRVQIQRRRAGVGRDQWVLRNPQL